MNGNILVLCDTEEEYAEHMTEYLKGHREVPWDIRTYTDVNELIRFAGDGCVELLVVAENAYTDEVRRLPVSRTVLLNESGVMRWDTVRNVNKYQQAENVYREILSEYTDLDKIPVPIPASESHTRLIGFFSPVHRSLQSTFALTFGQMLSLKYRTLYLNFEYFAGRSELEAEAGMRDLGDLIFFLNSDRDKFMLRMQTMVQRKGRMEYIPPMRSGMNLPQISADEWKEMLERIVQDGKYDFIIMDLSESIQGVLEIMRMCFRIYTLTKDDRAARSKMTQYEMLLSMAEYDDILEKTTNCRLPRFRRIPEEIELLTKGEVADYVRSLIGEVTS